MDKELIKTEAKIRKIGGKLEEDYFRFRNIVDNLNEVYFPLFYLMGFNKPEYTDKVIDILLANSILQRAKQTYIEVKTERVESGKLKLEKVLSKKTLNKEYPTPEAKEKVFKREIHRALVYRFNEIRDTYFKEYGNDMILGFYKFPLKILRKAISLSPEGFILDANKFIDIYEDYLEAHGSEGEKLHKEAVDAINRFFGGAVEITSEEMDRYFIIEYGAVKQNPKSINRESYLRLGYKMGKTTKK